MTRQELTVKSELKYKERVTLKFNIASLTLSLFSGLTLKLFTGVLVQKKKEEVEINCVRFERKRQKVETLLFA